MKTSIRFQLNGQSVTLDTDDDRMLLWVLRTELGLTGTKYGCGEALCGACTVTVEGKAVRSCKTPMRNVARKAVVTIGGLANDGAARGLQGHRRRDGGAARPGRWGAHAEAGGVRERLRRQFKLCGAFDGSRAPRSS